MSWIGSASMEKKVLREILLLQLTVYNSLKTPLKKSIFSKKNSNAVCKYSMDFNDSIKTTRG